MADPLRLFIIQLGVILLMTQLLSLLLRRMRQPRVIAEVLGGIILGPTACGRIPGFTEHVFPDASRPYLSLVANIGLVLFLFIVGLEIEGAVVKRNARLSFAIACGGMILPFALGAALSRPLFDQFVDPATVFPHFLLFVGVCFAITAFPVLCRILTELKLLDTTVGVVVLSAGVGNDVVGWTLLALAVSLVNASSGLTALWTLLAAVAWTLMLLFIAKPLLRWLAKWSGSLENGPTTLFNTITILVMFSSAFFTDIIGVHPIFGGFLTGLIVPREGGLAIAMTEKLEDMVSIMFLPLYFALSGLSTDLGLLDNGITWAYTIAIIVLAWIGKFGGCSVAARMSGFNWRESATIGTLMSCKGLVELIVLNVGLAAGILDTRVFSMFVLEALTLTFFTTPVVQYLYPPHFRVRATAVGAPHASLEAPQEKSRESVSPTENFGRGFKTRFTVVLDKIEHLPAMMMLTQLVQTEPQSAQTVAFPSPASRMDALRLIELDDRTSAVMRSFDVEALLHTDPLLNLFRTFGDLNEFTVSTSLAIVDMESFAPSISEHVHERSSHMVLASWVKPHLEHTASTPSANQLEFLFTPAAPAAHPSAVHSQFIRNLFATSPVDVALFVDPGHSATAGRRSQKHILIPFFGGPDDRVALAFAVQLCARRDITATVVRISRDSDAAAPGAPGATDMPERPPMVHSPETRGTITSAHGVIDTMYGTVTTQTRLQSDAADNFIWSQYTLPDPAGTRPAHVGAALSRMEFSRLNAGARPLAALVQLARARAQAADTRGRRFLVVLGRARRLCLDAHARELAEMTSMHSVGADARKTLGDVATALVASGVPAGLVVVQAAVHTA